MKKFIRYLRLKHRSPSDHEYVKRKQRYEVDFTLEPFAGLTPEYMEMSECRALHPTVTPRAGRGVCALARSPQSPRVHGEECVPHPWAHPRGHRAEWFLLESNPDEPEVAGSSPTTPMNPRKDPGCGPL